MTDQSSATTCSNHSCPLRRFTHFTDHDLCVGPIRKENNMETHQSLIGSDEPVRAIATDGVEHLIDRQRESNVEIIDCLAQLRGCLDPVLREFADDSVEPGEDRVRGESAICEALLSNLDQSRAIIDQVRSIIRRVTI